MRDDWKDISTALEVDSEFYDDIGAYVSVYALNNNKIIIEFEYVDDEDNVVETKSHTLVWIDD